MAPLLTVRVQYDGEDEEEIKEVPLKDGAVTLFDFLRLTELAFARTADNMMIHTARTNFIEDQFLVEGSVIRGPRKKAMLSLKELLGLPTNNGRAHQEKRMQVTPPTIVNTFPRSIRRCLLKPLVVNLMSRQPDTPPLFDAPPLRRSRQEPVQCQENIRYNVYVNAFDVVNQVLKAQSPDGENVFLWDFPSNAILYGEDSAGGITLAHVSDLELAIPGKNVKRGGAVIKSFGVLFEGRASESPDVKLADNGCLPPSLLVLPSDEPKVDLVDVFSEGDESHPITKSLGQLHTYSKVARWPITLLTCDGFTWAMVNDPDHPDDPFLSESFKSTDVNPTATELIYYTTKVLLGEEPLPTVPDADPVPAVNSHNPPALRPHRGSLSGPDATSSYIDGSALNGVEVRGAVGFGVPDLGANGLQVSGASGLGVAISGANAGKSGAKGVGGFGANGVSGVKPSGAETSGRGVKVGGAGACDSGAMDVLVNGTIHTDSVEVSGAGADGGEASGTEASGVEAQGASVSGFGGNCAKMTAVDVSNTVASSFEIKDARKDGIVVNGAGGIGETCTQARGDQRGGAARTGILAEAIVSSVDYTKVLRPAEKSYGLEQGGKRGDVYLTKFIGDGFVGAVFKGMSCGEAVAVKTLDMSHSTTKLRCLYNEIKVLNELSPLWDSKVPRLLAYGPYSFSVYAIVVSWVEGRPLAVSNKGLLDAALAALRSVHERGYLHGDVRLANFVVDVQSKVFCIDFGFASKSSDLEAFRGEEQDLSSLFYNG